MPQRRTAKKDLRKNKKRKKRNLDIKQQIKTVIKKFKASLEEKDESQKKKALEDLYKTLDKASAKKIIHPNKAARKKSRFTKLAKKSSS